MTRVISFDAGKSTGFAVVDYPDDGDPQLVALEQFVDEDYRDTAQHLDFLFDIHWEEYCVYVGERFDLRGHNQFVADLTPVRINAILDYFHRGVVWQTPAQAKGLVDNQTLKNLDMYPTGKTVGQPDSDDARDALRHSVHYAVKVLKHMPTIERGWPKPE